MGVQSVLKTDPLELARQLVASSEEQERRRAARVRVDFYRDRIAEHLQSLIAEIFSKPEVREKLKKFIKPAASVNVFKRIVNEIARPVSATPPRRRVTESAAPAYAALRQECNLDGKMDVSCRLVQATNTVWQFYRMSPRLGLVCHVLRPTWCPWWLTPRTRCACWR